VPFLVSCSGACREKFSEAAAQSAFLGLKAASPKRLNLARLLIKRFI
jgi:hypothetical protein